MKSANPPITEAAQIVVTTNCVLLRMLLRTSNEPASCATTGAGFFMPLSFSPPPTNPFWQGAFAISFGKYQFPSNYRFLRWNQGDSRKRYKSKNSIFLLQNDSQAIECRANLIEKQIQTPKPTETNCVFRQKTMPGIWYRNASNTGSRLSQIRALPHICF